MAKIQIYVPDELHAKLKSHGAEVNASALFQAALVEHLARLERRQAAAEAIAAFEAQCGPIDRAAARREVEADRAAGDRQPGSRKRPTRRRVA